MNSIKLLTAITLCLLLCAMIGLFVDKAHAQMGGRGLGAKAAARGGDTGLTGDKDIATKKGLAVFDTKRKSDSSKTPSRVQKMVGIGSIFVMIAVVKWL
jgi:hypothetical protein